MLLNVSYPVDEENSNVWDKWKPKFEPNYMNFHKIFCGNENGCISCKKHENYVSWYFTGEDNSQPYKVLMILIMEIMNYGLSIWV